MSALVTDDWHTRALYVDVLYIVSLSYGQILYVRGISVLVDHSQLERDCSNHRNIFRDCQSEENAFSFVASIAAVFVLKSEGG